LQQSAGAEQALAHRQKAPFEEKRKKKDVLALFQTQRLVSSIM